MKRELIAVLLFYTFAGVESRAQEQVQPEKVVVLALEKNFDVQLARNTVETATNDKQFIYGAFLPRVNAIAATVWNENNQELRFMNEAQNRSGVAKSNNSTASIQGVWTLFDGTRMFAASSRLKEAQQQSELQLKDQMVNTISSVILNYYDIVRQKQQLRALQEQMAVSEERVKLAERKFQVGTGAKPELLQARVDYNAQRAQALQQEALIIQLKAQLNASVNLQLSNDYDVADTILINLDLDRADFEQNVENTNYALQAMRKNLTISDLLVREQRAQGLPSLDMNGAFNFSRLDNAILLNPFGPTFNFSQGFNFGFTLNIPILNNMNNKRLIQQSRIFERRQQIAYEQQKVNVNIALQNAFTNYENAKQILLVEEENISLARENVFIALEVFRRGASTFVELRTAQQSLLEAYTRLINARYNAKVAETEILRLSGGLLREEVIGQ